MATVTKRGNSYRIRVSTGYDQSGKQIVKSTSWTPPPSMTKKQIEKELERQKVKFEEQVQNGQYIDSDIRLADFTEIWFNSYAETQLRANTLAQYKALLPRVNAALGHIQLKKLQPQHILGFYQSLSEAGIRADTKYKCQTDLKRLVKEQGLTMKQAAEASGISENTFRIAAAKKNVAAKTADGICKALGKPLGEVFTAQGTDQKLSSKTVHHYHVFLSSVLSTAVQWQVIPSNPCERVKPPKQGHKEAVYLDSDEAKRLLECLSGEPIMYKTLFTLILLSGMRRGEACGLTWNDIDFENSVIDINKTISYLPSKGVFENDTKNSSSRRVIKLPTQAFDLLREYRKEQAAQRLKLGDIWDGGNRVFTSWDGKPIHPSTVTGWFARFVKRHDLPPIHIHSLRHTNATLLISSGAADIKTISSRLGHADVSTTGNIYAHAIKAADERAAQALDDIFTTEKQIKKAVKL